MTDEEIRQAGFNFIPPQRFLASPFEISENQEEPVVDEGIVATNAFVGGGGGGNDLTKITNLNYDPYRYRLAADIDEGSEEEYYTRPEPTGLGKLVQLAGSFVPGRGVASFIGDFLPVSRRAILENELAGEGVLVDDIGRIVQGKGDYNTAENVMAGYNPYAMTAETFDKRIARIQDTLEKKYGDRNYTGDKTKLDERIKAIEEAKQNFLDAQGRTDTIYDFEKEEKEKKKKDNILFKLFGKKDKQDITTSSADGGGGAVTTTDTSATSQGDGGGIDISGAGVIRSAQNAFKGDSGPTTQQEADYGYGSDYGFAKGGRVKFNTGGHSRFEVGSGYYGETPTKLVSGEGGGDNQNTTIINRDNDNKVVDTSNLLSKNPEISFNLSDPKNLALINARLYNENILDNDDINLEGTLSNSLGPIDFTNYFTDEGLKNINVSTDALGGLFTANVDPNLQLQNISYEREIGPGNLRFTGDRDNQFLSYGITYKNGGLASLL